MYYYEVPHEISLNLNWQMSVVPPGIYAVALGPSDMPALAYRAERIWLDNGGKVRYCKHREWKPAVNMKEFTWIKMRAKELSTRGVV